MRHELAILAAVFVGELMSGCVHSIPLNAPQTCAYQGMVLNGINVGHGGAFATSGDYSASVRSWGEDIQCNRASTKFDNCMIPALNASIEPLHEHNKYVVLKNLSLIVGYVFYVLPGVGLYFYYDSQSDDAREESTRRIRHGAQACQTNMEAGV